MQSKLHSDTNLLLQNKSVRASAPNSLYSPTESGQTQWDALRASHLLASKKPFSSFKVRLYYHTRTFFRKKWIPAFPARYAPLCEAQSFPKWKVRGNAKYKCGLGFAKQFCGRRIRKTETDFLKSFLGWASAPQEGAGGMRGGVPEFLKGGH